MTHGRGAVRDSWGASGFHRRTGQTGGLVPYGDGPELDRAAELSRRADVHIRIRQQHPLDFKPTDGFCRRSEQQMGCS
jgi:hypothetical protein